VAGQSDNPGFFSLRYHTVFFPSVLKRQFIRAKQSNRATSFTSTLEMMIGLAICVILAIIGIPFAIPGNSVVGWIMTTIGVGGIILLLAVSIAAQWKYRPSYNDFLVWVFFFFLSLGVFAGILIGMECHSIGLGVSASLVGLIAGYCIGILAGLRVQHLGWFAVVFNFIAAFGTIVVVGTAVVMAVLVATG
jgi:hypothetical protein